MTEAIIRLPIVQQRTGLSRSEIYRREGLGQFPKRVSIGARSVGWVHTEIQAWIEARIKESRKGGNHEHA
ncbi:MAG: AlpA family transcriptional regulator [Gammaproteobacteria bacterium]|nr:AlpA family transcriptional regulator [Gammaproteobacteria bacterium]